MKKLLLASALLGFSLSAWSYNIDRSAIDLSQDEYIKVYDVGVSNYISTGYSLNVTNTGGVRPTVEITIYYRRGADADFTHQHEIAIDLDSIEELVGATIRSRRVDVEIVGKDNYDTEIVPLARHTITVNRSVAADKTAITDMSGQWYDPAYSGMGIVIQQMASRRSKFTAIQYYGYSANGEPLWLVSNLSAGGWEAGEPKKFVMYRSVPDAATDFTHPPAAGLTRWGTVEITPTTCSRASATIKGDTNTTEQLTFDLSLLVENLHSLCSTTQKLN